MHDLLKLGRYYSSVVRGRNVERRNAERDERLECRTGLTLILILTFNSNVNNPYKPYP